MRKINFFKNLSVMLFLFLTGVSCKTIYERESGLNSFEIHIVSPSGDELGTPDNPLHFVSGALCGVEGGISCPKGEECIKYCSKSGKSCESDNDCTEKYEQCIGMCTMKVYISVEAIGNDGKLFPFDGFLELDAKPGFIPQNKRNFKISGGKTKDPIPVFFARGIGETRIWVVDTGYVPVKDRYGECNDGIDNDGNGLIDLEDPGCVDATDAIEKSITGAGGVSEETIYFENPRIRHIQYTSSIIHSPLENQDVLVKKGNLVVTNITSNGMYVTDLTEQAPTLPDGEPGYYNSIFLYTWTTPTEVGYGDKLCWFAGGVVEYEGNTQIKFPTYKAYLGKDETDPLCKANTLLDPDAKVPDPVPITDMLVPEEFDSPDYKKQIYANSLALEPFENSLVSVENVQVSNLYLACDVNENGIIENGTDEDTCRDFCQQNPLCTQLESYFKYKQFGIFVDNKKKMYVSAELLLEYSPLNIEFLGQEDKNQNCEKKYVWIGKTKFLEYECPDSGFKKINGNLRHIFLCPKDYRESSCNLQLYTIVPRFDDDLIL